MSDLVGKARKSWKRSGLATRLWLSGLLAVSLAAGVVVVGSSVASASQHASGGPAAGGPAMPAGTRGAASGAMGTAGGTLQGATPGGGSGSMPAASGAMAGAAASSSVCQGLKGATVMANGMVMAPVPSSPPTAAQKLAAAQLVAEVTADTRRYSNLQTAEGDGYQPISARRGAMTHYLDRSVVRHGDVLDPTHPSALMFANTVNGPVLIGAMFLGPAPCQPGPDIGGSLTQWHAHDNLCISGGELTGKVSPEGSCAVGIHNTSTYFMLHVWTAPQLASRYQFQADLPPSAYTSIIESGRP